VLQQAFEFLGRLHKGFVPVDGLNRVDHALDDFGRAEVSDRVTYAGFNRVLRRDKKPSEGCDLALVVSLSMVCDHVAGVGCEPVSRFGVQARSFL